MRVLALGNFYDSYHSNYDVLGISTDLDFEKLHEYFRQKVKYIDVFLRSEGISFPKNLNEFTLFLEKVSYRQHNRRFGSVTKESSIEFFEKYPEINEFFEENLVQIKKDPEHNRVPSIFRNFSIKNLEDMDVRPRNAAICFCDALPDIIMYEDIYAAFSYAKKHRIQPRNSRL